MPKVAIDLNFLPNLEFFAAISGFDELIYFPDQRFQRRTFINRTDILGPNKVQRLTVPIQGRRPAIPISEIKIDYGQDWIKSHLKSIQTAYGKAPFYEYYYPYFEEIYHSKPELLLSLNQQILTLCLKLLGVSAKLQELDLNQKITDFKDIRGLISPRTHFSQANFYQAQAYFQLFGADFEPNLSIMDLLFCEGTESNGLILKSLKKH